ncbi:aromatic amino acid transport family protein [Glaesserella parasuis]|uniref:aromatic amino acid transport family protein n=1 Tax=Glaesserella parasuis TaxID=738 RepID=UPI0003AC4B3D|nr:aromatic amino acid transport family protein [Glaesserella parasuis]EQA02667.1 aromatic amino acid transport family protein [Glaesserella parasuis MN-H]EQA13735.1 aromatic amino acid transport family protein [Glaesserella parasuis SW140]MCT8545312.1 aromatic amino acid transporter [Glaesserella parasuis]MCT8572727.1 aromatic amino acid transporter [Glaesserella parasuis]MCT8686098.1 aromatic amino acid transporter [Glaesserella parasuis]
MKNKTLGSTLIVAGTTIGAGMLAMPLTSAGIGFGFTFLLLVALWLLLCFSALLFVEVYQTVDSDAGLGTLAEKYYGTFGRVVSTTVLIVFLYAILSAYVSGGSSLLAVFLPTIIDAETTTRISGVIFTLVFGVFIILGTTSVDAVNRLLFTTKILAFILVLFLLLPNVSIDNLMAMPIDNALLISASPIFFTAFGFHGSIPSLNKYLEGNVKALRISIVVGTSIPLVAYILWQLATHGVLTQTEFLQILEKDPTLNGLAEAARQITGSSIIGAMVRIFSALALITSFLGVALGLFEALEDLLKRVNINAGRVSLGALTFIPPMLFAFFYPQGFIAALGYAGQMFAFYAIVLPIAMVWKLRRQNLNLPYQVKGGSISLLLALVIGVFIVMVPFLIESGWLPKVVG